MHLELKILMYGFLFLNLLTVWRDYWLKIFASFGVFCLALYEWGPTWSMSALESGGRGWLLLLAQHCFPLGSSSVEMTPFRCYLKIRTLNGSHNFVNINIHKWINKFQWLTFGLSPLVIGFITKIPNHRPLGVSVLIEGELGLRSERRMNTILKKNLFGSSSTVGMEGPQVAILCRGLGASKFASASFSSQNFLSHCTSFSWVERYLRLTKSSEQMTLSVSMSWQRASRSWRSWDHWPAPRSAGSTGCKGTCMIKVLY